MKQPVPKCPFCGVPFNVRDWKCDRLMCSEVATKGKVTTPDSVEIVSAFRAEVKQDILNLYPRDLTQRA